MITIQKIFEDANLMGQTNKKAADAGQYNLDMTMVDLKGNPTNFNSNSGTPQNNNASMNTSNDNNLN